MQQRPATSDVQRTIEAVWRIESTRLIAGIARVTRDIAVTQNSREKQLLARKLQQIPQE